MAAYPGRTPSLLVVSLCVVPICDEFDRFLMTLLQSLLQTDNRCRPWCLPRDHLRGQPNWKKLAPHHSQNHSLAVFHCSRCLGVEPKLEANVTSDARTRQKGW